ncbi:MAG: adenosylcobinamide-GDP ribazoletransferase, partial [Ruegeria sp.]
GLLTGVLAACLFSRAAMPAFRRALPNARQWGLSPGVGVPPLSSVMAGLGLAAVLSLLLLGWSAMIPMLCALLAAALVGRIAKRKVGGQTGDILGATQQVTEIVFLLVLVGLI